MNERHCPRKRKRLVYCVFQSTLYCKSGMSDYEGTQLIMDYVKIYICVVGNLFHGKCEYAVGWSVLLAILLFSTCYPPVLY